MAEAGQRSRLFGTDGVRGVAGDELTASLALNLSVAAAAVLGRAEASWELSVVYSDGVSAPGSPSAVYSPVSASSSTTGVLPVGSATV